MTVPPHADVEARSFVCPRFLILTGLRTISDSWNLDGTVAQRLEQGT